MSQSQKQIGEYELEFQQDVENQIQGLIIEKKPSDLFADDVPLSLKLSLIHNVSSYQQKLFTQQNVQKLFISPQNNQIVHQNQNRLNNSVIQQNLLQRYQQRQRNTIESQIYFRNTESLIIARSSILQESIKEQLLLDQKQENSLQKHKVNKCRCKYSRCLKLYCQCFKNQGICGKYCTCVNCENTHENQAKRKRIRKKIIDKDSFAFIEKVRYNGCRCRKNHCFSNYCECFKMGVTCGKYCKCSDCQNCSENFKRKQQKKKKNYLK